jgi:hypothetical protein
MIILFSIKTKTISKNNFFSNLKIIFFFKKLKKFIITKASFKYNKCKEQYGICYNNLILQSNNIKFIPKFLEIIFIIIFLYSNKYCINLIKKELFFF